METEIMIRSFPSTRKDKGFYAYIHYDNWTKQVTCEGRTKEEAYGKALKYCNKNNIEYRIMKKEEKLELKASDYAISHYESDKTYTSLEVHKMLCDAYVAGNNDMEV